MDTRPLRLGGGGVMSLLWSLDFSGDIDRLSEKGDMDNLVGELKGLAIDMVKGELGGGGEEGGKPGLAVENPGEEGG